MYLMYVDESGDPGMTGSPTRYFMLSGLVIHELRWSPYVDELIAFRQNVKANFGLKLREEIHAAHLLTRPGELARIAKHERLEIIRRYADQLAGMPDFSVINIVVDKLGKAITYDPFEQAWQALIQRFENTLAHRNFPGPRHRDERGMIFPDRTDQRKLDGLLRRMRAYNPIGNRAAYGLGYRNLQIRSVIETANYRDSHLSYLVQSADLCAFLLYQHWVPSAYVRKKSGQNYFLRLRPILCRRASRSHPDGVVVL